MSAATDTRRGFAVLVVWSDGGEEYLSEGLSERPARFPNRRDAEHQRDFMRIGMADECESISVVEYPGQERGTR